MVLNATKDTTLKNCTSLQLSSETHPLKLKLQTEQQHRFDGGIMQLTKPCECQKERNSFHVFIGRLFNNEKHVDMLSLVKTFNYEKRQLCR